MRAIGLPSLLLTLSSLAPPAHAAGKAELAARADLVAANHILVKHDVLDGWGHVSVRSPGNPAHFFLARSMAPARVTSADILEVDIESCTVVGSAAPTYVERFIHCGLYKARPDIGAVIHSHSPSFVPYGVTHTPLLPLYHVTAFLGAGTGFFEIRDAAGAATDMLVKTPALGAALAKALGDRPLVLMRGHGASIVGASLAQATYRAVYAQTGAQIQASARLLGPVEPLSPGEAATAAKTVDGLMGRVWDLWKAEIQRSR